MKINKIISFGDSWTAGVGYDTVEENSFFEKYTDKNYSRQLLNEARKSNSWTRFLSDKFECDYINKGEPSISNHSIVNNLFKYLKNNTVSDGDLIIIMFSSSIRNPIPFFPDVIVNGGLMSIFSFKDVIEILEKNNPNIPSFFSNFANKDDKDYLLSIDSFYEYYMKKFVKNGYMDFSYYNMYNQNIIVFLQNYFNYFNINYYMCDAFESMLSYTEYSSYNISKDINYSNYYKLKEKEHFLSFLKKNYGDYVFSQEGKYPHPNKIGYQLIADELYKNIVENK